MVRSKLKTRTSQRRELQVGDKATLTNRDVAELLARSAEDVPAPLNRAFRRASRRAFLWPEEVSELMRTGRSLTELAAVGPFLEKTIKRWIDRPPDREDSLPDIRANFLTLTQARAILAEQPDLKEQLKGDLQMHTTWSDGTGSVQEMADAAAERNYEYVATTDHAKGLKIAGGIDETDLRKQGNEINGVNRSLSAAGHKLQVLRSIELNLNPQGEGDMEPSALAELDIVLGCFHSSLRRKEDQTERYLAALRNPTIQILGHPRGRIYNFRLGLSADWSRVFGLAAELDKAMEIDCYPDRQDLSGDLLTIARIEGCRISLGTDSHGPSQLGFIEFGAAAATVARIPAERIVNTMSREVLLSWVKGVRSTTQAGTRRVRSA